MTSKLIVNSLRHTGASADAITMDASGNVTFPANATCSGTATGFGIPGITEFDYWYLASSTGGGVNAVISSGWNRSNPTGGAAQIGTGMTESSGIFSFPSTGKWLVVFNGWIEVNGSDAAIVNVEVTINNSDYNRHALCVSGIGSNQLANQASCFAFVDVTNTSNTKVRFLTSSMGSGSYLYGQSIGNGVATGVIFARIGDT